MFNKRLENIVLLDLKKLFHLSFFHRRIDSTQTEPRLLGFVLPCDIQISKEIYCATYVWVFELDSSDVNRLLKYYFPRAISKIRESYGFAHLSPSSVNAMVRYNKNFTSLRKILT